MLSLYSHYKFHHFFSCCFGLGCGLVSYRPYCNLAMPCILTLFFTIAFEIVGICFGLPSHTKKCSGPPYSCTDVVLGLVVAALVALFNLDSSCMCTMGYGSGLIVFAFSGEIRKYKSLWNKQGTFYYTYYR